MIVFLLKKIKKKLMNIYHIFYIKNNNKEDILNIKNKCL